MRADDTLIKRIAIMVAARLSCERSGNSEWFDTWSDRLSDVERNQLPNGSGIDNGTWIDLAASSADKIVLRLGFHHMDDGGGYDGWTHHKITARPSFVFGVDLTISGRDRNDVKDYLADTFHYALRQPYQPMADELAAIAARDSAAVKSTNESEAHT